MRTSNSSSPSGSSRNASRISRPIGGLVERRDRASTLAWLYLRAMRAVSASTHSAARAPGTLFAAIEAPVPDQQQTTPRSAAPSATRRATAALASTHSSAPPAGGPWSSTSCPASRRAATTSSVSGVTSSDPTAMITCSP